MMNIGMNLRTTADWGSADAHDRTEGCGEERYCDKHTGQSGRAPAHDDITELEETTMHAGENLLYVPRSSPNGEDLQEHITRAYPFGSVGPPGYVALGPAAAT
jgi:hypothetical protein